MSKMYLENYNLRLMQGPRPEVTGANRIYFLIKPIVDRFSDPVVLDVGGSVHGAIDRSIIPGATIIDPAVGTNVYDLVEYKDRCDVIICSHTLEHFNDPYRAMDQMVMALKDKGVIIIYGPYPGVYDFDPLINEKVRPEHKWQPTPVSVSRLLLCFNIKVTYCEWQQDEYFSFLVIGEK